MTLRPVPAPGRDDRSASGPPPGGAPDAGVQAKRWRPGRPVLALLWALLAAALLGWPFLMLAPNRLVSGQGLALLGLASGAQVWLMLPLGLLLALGLWPADRLVDRLADGGSDGVADGVAPAGLRRAGAERAGPRPSGARPPLRDGMAVLAASLLLVGLLALAGHEAALQARQGTALMRVSLGGAFWAALLLAWAMLADALQRLPLGLGWRLAVSAGLPLSLLAALLLALAGGAFDALSLLKEYANRQDVFHAALWRHGQIVGTALLATLLIGLPLGLAAARRPALARPLLAALNLLQTVPSIALFGLLIAPLAALGAAWPSSGVQGIGLLPAVIALTGYALLPVVHGLASGLQQVDAAVIDAATGMGLNARQRFWQVELPLALPLLWSALRLTTVQLIGLAVVAALIGAGGLGALVFQGLLSSALDLVLLGVLPVVGLALLVDAAFGGVAAALARPGAPASGVPA